MRFISSSAAARALPSKQNCAAAAGIPSPSSSVNEASNNRSAAPSRPIAFQIRVGPIPGVNINAIQANLASSRFPTPSASYRSAKLIPLIPLDLDPNFYST